MANSGLPAKAKRWYAGEGVEIRLAEPVGRGDPRAFG